MKTKVPVFEELCLVVVSVGFWVGLVVGFSVVLGRVVGFVVITVVRTVEPSAIEPGTVPFVCSPVVFTESVLCAAVLSELYSLLASPFGSSTSAKIISSITPIMSPVPLSVVSGVRAPISDAPACEP